MSDTDHSGTDSTIGSGSDQEEEIACGIPEAYAFEPIVSQLKPGRKVRRIIPACVVIQLGTLVSQSMVTTLDTMTGMDELRCELWI